MPVMDTCSTQLDLTDRVVLITGSARGLGRAYANSLARYGARIGLHDAGVNLGGVDPDATIAEQAAREFAVSGLSATAFTVLLDGEKSCRELVDDVLHRLGRIDALIHNAGIVSWRDPAVVGTEDYGLSSRVNNDAAFFLISAVLPTMRAQEFGRIVLTTSGWALHPATGSQELALYAHGKGAQLGLGMALARGAGHSNIRTNIIAPVAATRIFRGKANATLRPETVAGAVAWLASPACTVTGCLVRAHGGTLSLSRLVDVQSRRLGADAEDPLAAGAAIASMADASELCR